ncbi:MAG TPA: hypothetical protein VGJ14_17160, partial [Sporichthyaceae bacterium]
MSRSTTRRVTTWIAAGVLTVSAPLLAATTAHAAAGDKADCSASPPAGTMYDDGSGTVRFVIVGTSGNEALIGTSGPDIIFGKTGDHYMWGGKGDDILCGGSGKDRMFGGS